MDNAIEKLFSRHSGLVVTCITINRAPRSVLLHEDKYIFVCARKLRRYGVSLNIWYSAHFWRKIWYSEYLREIRTSSPILGSAGYTVLSTNKIQGKIMGKFFFGNLLKNTKRLWCSSMETAQSKYQDKYVFVGQLKCSICNCFVNSIDHLCLLEVRQNLKAKFGCRRWSI